MVFLPRRALPVGALFAWLLATGAVSPFTTSSSAQSAQGQPASGPPASGLPARPVTTARSLPTLTLSSAVLPNGAGTLTLSLPAGVSLPDKVRVALFEAGRPALVEDVTRRFSPVGNTLQSTLTVQSASPGRYEVRVLGNDKARAPLTQPATLLVPGVEREPGWWIYNGSIVLPPAPSDASVDASTAAATPVGTTAPATSSLPLFLPGLRRDLSDKPKIVARDVATPVAPSFKLWPLPSLDELATSTFDFGAFQTNLVRSLTEARTRGDVGYGGFIASCSGSVSVEAARAAVGRLQTLRNTVAPDAALVLEIRNYDNNAQVAETVAPLCDAVKITARRRVLQSPLVIGSFPSDTPQVSSEFTPLREDNGTWGVKIARRIAEDQPNFDLPIFYEDAQGQNSSTLLSNLDALTAGSNLIIGNNASLQSVYQRNAPLLVGSVTLEDAGVLPLSNFALVGMERLRLASRVPQYARVIPLETDKRAQPETFYARIDESTTAVQLEALRRSAAAGGRVYLEGSPDVSSPLAARMKELGGGTLAALPANERENSTLLNLSDPWFFGTLRGTELGVTQRATVTLSSGTMASQTKSQEGLDQIIAPRVVAKLADGSPGMIVNPVGKGQVLWMPYTWNLPRPANENPVNALKGDLTSTYGSLLLYDQAIAGWLSPALVQLPPEASRALRIMVRRSPKGTLLVSLTNPTNADITTPMTVGGAPTVCLDLLTERDFPVKTSGFDGTATVTVPANGAVLLACAFDRKTLEDERNAPRLKAKLK